LDEYLRWTINNNLIPAEYEIKRISGGVVPLKIAKNYATDRILLCGDAMGLVKVLIGEGIYYAMKSGKIAGKTISESRINIAKRYKKNIKKLIYQVYITPYIPPKIFTLAFWSVFFITGKYVEKLKIFNPIIDFFSKMIIHRLKHRDSYYNDERITN